MKSIALMLAALTLTLPWAALAEVPDRCDKAWLSTFLATKKGDPITSPDGYISVSNFSVMGEDGIDQAQTKSLDASKICDQAVADLVTKTGDASLLSDWAGGKQKKPSLHTQARLLLYLNAVYKLSDQRAAAAFGKASAVLAEAGKIGAVTLGQSQTLAQAAKLTVAPQRGGADGVIDASDVSNQVNASVKPSPDDIGKAQGDLIGTPPPAKPGQPAPPAGKDSLQPGPAVVQFNQSILDWVKALSKLRGSSGLYRQFVNQQGTSGTDLPVADKLLAATVSDGAANDPAQMRQVVGQLTGLTALPQWGDATAGATALSDLDKAQRNALFIRYSQVQQAMQAVLAVKGGHLTAPGALTTTAANALGANPTGITSPTDAVLADRNAFLGQVASNVKTNQQPAVPQHVAFTGAGNNVTVTPLDGGPAIPDVVRTDASGNPATGEAQRIAAELEGGHPVVADLNAAAATLTPNGVPNTPVTAANSDPAAASAAADFKAHSGCDNPADLFRSDANRYKQHEEDALADTAAGNSAKRGALQAAFVDWEKGYRKQCEQTAGPEAGPPPASLDPAAAKQVWAQCEAAIAQKKKDLDASIRANADADTAAHAALDTKLNANINVVYHQRVDDALPKVEQSYLRDEGRDSGGGEGAATPGKLGRLAQDAGWGGPEQLTRVCQGDKNVIQMYFDKDWTKGPDSARVDECALKKIGVGKNITTGAVDRYCVHDALLTYVKSMTHQCNAVSAPTAPSFSTKL